MDNRCRAAGVLALHAGDDAGAVGGGLEDLGLEPDLLELAGDVLSRCALPGPVGCAGDA